MNNMSSQHHSFDIALATKYGVEEAILLHHFQHWIRINKMTKKNFREGRTWTYQSRKHIAAHFPYFTEDRIRRLCEKLVEEGVLVQNNFNKNPLIRTLWYAFTNEEEWELSDVQIKEKFTKGKSAKSNGKSAKCSGESAKCYNDKDSKDTDTKDSKEREGEQAPHFPSVPKGDVCISPPKKRKRVVEEKIEKAERVHITSTQHTSLIKKANGDENLVTLWYEELSKWKIGKEIEGGNDYFNILNWVINACKKPNGPKTLQDDQKLLNNLKEYAHKSPALQIDFGADYVVFRRIGSVEYKVGEPGFQEKVKSALRKMNVPLN